MIVFGLGTGRCGTTSLQTLLNSQDGAACFHEANPACMSWEGAEATVLSVLNDFRAALSGGPRGIALTRIDKDFLKHSPTLDRYQTLPEVRLVGDVASYYLRYVEFIAGHCDEVRFPCLRRPRQEVVDSFMAWTTPLRSRLPHFARRLLRRPHGRNHWQDHDGRRWQFAPIWGNLYPKFNDARDKADAIGRYWDAYYAEAERLERTGLVRIFDTGDLNTAEGQRAILVYCGIDRPTTLPRAHENRRKAA